MLGAAPRAPLDPALETPVKLIVPDPAAGQHPCARVGAQPGEVASRCPFDLGLNKSPVSAHRDRAEGGVNTLTTVKVHEPPYLPWGPIFGRVRLLGQPRQRHRSIAR